jgi:hypothetical protein
MKYRVHLFVTVRLEQEVEADSPASAAHQALSAESSFYERFDRSGGEYAGVIDDWCVVDALTDKMDYSARLVSDYSNCQWLELTDLPPTNDHELDSFADEPLVVNSCSRVHVE